MKPDRKPPAEPVPIAPLDRLWAAVAFGGQLDQGGRHHVEAFILLRIGLVDLFQRAVPLLQVTPVARQDLRLQQKGIVTEEIGRLEPPRQLGLERLPVLNALGHARLGQPACRLIADARALARIEQVKRKLVEKIRVPGLPLMPVGVFLLQVLGDQRVFVEKEPGQERDLLDVRVEGGRRARQHEQEGHHHEHGARAENQVDRPDGQADVPGLSADLGDYGHTVAPGPAARRPSTSRRAVGFHPIIVPA